ncbi:uncharacterized protein LOC105275436 [Ooceraea biroi]|uniref:uncharacterized protein LOC105275436 n=1 Tax=Ooceraea biroi TaxID=2015173 RepID=UPI0005BA3448|nr:uncharacterized protein LOC105275436 [Ooceraea biroi]XP_019885932.1 uncharacterized protein LOC105275436 [Ooceraea biroi]XP_019885933.1 uncharacterized protein LOC105275436 [Ooceraea biroi]
MFSYMRYIFDEHFRQWTNNTALEDDSSERSSIDTYIEPRFLETLKNSCRQASLRKTNQSDICEEISSTCTEIKFQLLELNERIELDKLSELTREFDIIAAATIYYNLGIIYKDCLGLQDFQVSLYKLSMSHVILEDIELDCNAILIAVKTLIAMSELQETQRWLNEAIRLCLQYIEQNNFQSKPIYTYLADVSKEEDLRISLRLLYRNMIGRMEKLYSASDKMDEWIETVHDCLDDRAGIINFPYGACDWSKAAIMIKMWKEAAELLLSVIEGEAAYRDLYFTTQEKLLDIINKLDYYYEHCQQIGET